MSSIIEKIRENPLYLQSVFFKDQTYEMCEIAVSLNPIAITYVDLSTDYCNKLINSHRNSIFKIYIEELIDVNEIKNGTIKEFILTIRYFEKLSISNTYTICYVNGFHETPVLNLKIEKFSNVETLRQNILDIYKQYRKPTIVTTKRMHFSEGLSCYYVKLFGITDDFIKLAHDSYLFIDKLSDVKKYLLYHKTIWCNYVHLYEIVYNGLVLKLYNRLEMIAGDLDCYKLVITLNQFSKDAKKLATFVRISTKSGQIPLTFWITDVNILYN